MEAGGDGELLGVMREWYGAWPWAGRQGGFGKDEVFDSLEYVHCKLSWPGPRAIAMPGRASSTHPWPILPRATTSETTSY